MKIIKNERKNKTKRSYYLMNSIIKIRMKNFKKDCLQTSEGNLKKLIFFEFLLSHLLRNLFDTLILFSLSKK